MKVNNKHMDASKMIFMSFSYTSPQVARDILKIGLFQKEMDGTISPAYRILQIAFDNENALSNFVTYIRSQFVLDIGDGYLYDCLAYSDSQITSLGNDKYIASFPLSVIRKKTYRSLKIRNGQKIDIDGTHECGVVYDVISHVTGTINVNGIQIKNVSANDHIIIDGINIFIKCNEVNKFVDSNIKKFPTLMPGVNEIQLSDGVDVSIGYYPIFM